MMHQKNNTLIFIEKSKAENQPFSMAENNPFDIALNDGLWYRKSIKIPYLRDKLRGYYYGHHEIMEIVFIWENSFSVLVVNNNGNVESYFPE
jgi:hypothetical protein